MIGSNQPLFSGGGLVSASSAAVSGSLSAHSIVFSARPAQYDARDALLSGIRRAHEIRTSAALAENVIKELATSFNDGVRKAIDEYLSEDGTWQVSNDFIAVLESLIIPISE